MCEPQVQVYNAQQSMTTSTTTTYSRSYAAGAATLAACLTYTCTAMFFLWAIFFTVIAWNLACVLSLVNAYIAQTLLHLVAKFYLAYLATGRSLLQYRKA